MTVPAAVQRAQQLHDQYLTALDAYRTWTDRQELKITLWSTIRSVLLQADASDDGLDTADLLEALGSDKDDVESLSEEQKILLSFGAETSDPPGSVESWTGAQMASDRLLYHFQHVEMDDVPLFFHFGWELVLRKVLVDYHAQRLRIYIYTGELDNKEYPPVNWRQFQALAERATDEDNALGFFIDDIFTDHVDHLFPPVTPADSPFFEGFAELDYGTQVGVLFSLTMGLSSSQSGRLLLCDLVWGGLGYGTVEGRKTFRIVDVYERRENSVVNWDTGDGFTANLGLNQFTILAECLAIQFAPGFLLATRTARVRADNTDLLRIERDAATVLGAFTSDPGTALSDLSLPMMAKQNQHSARQVETFIKATHKTLTSSLAAIPAKLIVDYAQKAGIEQTLLAAVPEATTLADVPDQMIIKSFQRQDLPDGRRLEAAVAMKRYVHLYGALSAVYGSALFFTADSRDDSTVQKFKDVNTFAGVLTNTSALLRSLGGDPIDWKYLLPGSSPNVAPADEMVFVLQPDEIKDRLDALDSQVKSNLLADLDKAADELYRLEATTHLVEANAFETRKYLFSPPTEGTASESFIKNYYLFTSRAKIEQARTRVENIRSLLGQNKSAEIADILTDKRHLSVVHTLSSHAVESLSAAMQSLGEHTDPSYGLSVDDAKVQLLKDAGITDSETLGKISGAYDTPSQVDPQSSQLVAATDRLDRKIRHLSIALPGRESLGGELNLERRQQLAKRTEAIRDWFVRQGADSKEVKLAERTTSLLDAKVPKTAVYTPSLYKFTGRIALELLGVVTDAIDIIITSMEAYEAVEVGDYSAAAGGAISVAGTGIMMFASVTGPLFWIGAAMVLGGIALVTYTTDDKIVIWLRHTYFGRFWYKPAFKDFDHEYSRWGWWLGSVVGKALEIEENQQSGTTAEGDESVTEEEPYGFVRRKLRTYTKVSEDSDVSAYFASQLAWFYRQSRDFDVTETRVYNDQEGYPTLKVTVEDPNPFGDTVQAFEEDSVLLVRPVVFAETVGDHSHTSVLYQSPLKVSIAGNLRTHEWTRNKIRVFDPFEHKYQPPEMPTTEKLYWDAPPQDVTFFGKKESPYHQYLATRYRKRLEPDEEWKMPKIDIEISLNDRWKQKWGEAYVEDGLEYRYSPLNHLFNFFVESNSGEGIDLRKRMNHDDSLDEGALQAQFAVSDGRILKKTLGVIVYNLPKDLRKSAEDWAAATDDSLAKMIRRGELNPFATRVGAFVDADNYPTDPPPWRNDDGTLTHPPTDGEGSQ
ncbi:hypothetical protein [Haloferax sp. DFSO52]|uniref:hypothetical protein n=1 Tax=Haloferax sp. DFSO52 TaxID=3388505 RepID=UPI003A83F589